MEKISPANQYFWHALYIKSRAEKKALADLQNKGIEAFLPLHKKLRQWTDRKKWVDMPLIPGYLFVKVSRKEYYLALQSNHIVTYVRFEGKAAIIPDRQIEYLKLLLKQDNLDIEIIQEKLEPGQTIEVVAGPLIGLRGKLLQRNGKNKVAIELEDIGHSALVEISVNDITAVKEN
jgi:transcription antitermination factor NusG